MADEQTRRAPADALPESDPDEPHTRSDDAAPPVTRRVIERAATTVATAVVAAADEIVDTVRPAAEHLAASTRDAAAERARRLSRRVTRNADLPLPNLYDVHPEAHTAPQRELGLHTIPVEEIVGTAVKGPAQRGGDFQPLPRFRSSNWEARWQRILKAHDRMDSLPPIDVLRTREGYWVTDGHNRVAAAKVIGQRDVDADVRAVVLPGDPPPRPSGPLAPVLAESAQVEAAARGRLTRGSTLGRTIQDRDLGKRNDGEADATREDAAPDPAAP